MTTIILKCALILTFRVIAPVRSTDTVDELIFVHILFRHGDKNMGPSYPTDQWGSEEYWPEGYGQLTNVGRQQCYELGSYLRRRYINLMPNNGSYHKNNIYVRSTDVDRTLMSAAHTLAGMFPPAGDQIWNRALMWQAIPIHTLPVDEDFVLGGTNKPCPLYDEVLNEYLQSAEIQTMTTNNRTLIEYLAMHAGREIDKICDIRKIYRPLWIQSLKKLPLPKWAENVFVAGGDMEKIVNFCFKVPTNTKLLARLQVGHLLREILDHFNAKKNGTLSPDRSIWMYSAHDLTVASVLNALNLFEPHVPDYASSVFFELHRFNETFHIEIFYKRSRGEDKQPLEPISIPNCGPKCPLDKFQRLYTDIIPTKDFDSECSLDNR